MVNCAVGNFLFKTHALLIYTTLFPGLFYRIARFSEKFQIIYFEISRDINNLNVTTNRFQIILYLIEFSLKIKFFWQLPALLTLFISTLVNQEW